MHGGRPLTQQAYSMNAPLHFARALAVIVAGPLVAGCGSDGGSPGKEVCNVSCGSLSAPATFTLSCDATNLVNVVVSGPCATDASTLPYSVDSTSPQNLYVGSLSPGVCHVGLTFATGYTYSTDVTFTSVTTTGGCCSGTGVNPTQTNFMVNNPSTTCVDAGLEAGTDAGIDEGDGR